MSTTRRLAVLLTLLTVPTLVSADLDPSLVRTMRSMYALSKAKNAKVVDWMTPQVRLAGLTAQGRVENTVPAQVVAGVFTNIPADRSILPVPGQEETAVLYARDLGGGKVLVRSRMMDQIATFTPDGKMVASKQFYPMYVDLTFTKSGNRYLLSGCDLAVVDFRKDVLEKYQQFLQQKRPTASAAAAEYQRLVGAFVEKYEPNRPTVRELPTGPAQLLPARLVTPAVRQSRQYVANVVARQFPAFAGKQTLEAFRTIGNVQFYISIHERASEMTFAYGRFVFRIRLVFARNPRGTWFQATIPIVQPAGPVKPIARQNMWAVAGPIRKPVAATGTMVLTDLARLKANHPKSYDRIVDYLRGWGTIIDIAGRSDPAAIDQLVEKTFDRTKNDCLFIFGNHDVVPHATMPNPAYDPKGDDDKIIYTDDPYADFDHDASQAPEILCVRMPDDDGILAATDSVLYRAAPADGSLAFADYAAYGMQKRTTAELIVQFANGDDDLLRMCLPNTDKTFSPSLFKGHNVALNLHGSDKYGQAYWGEDPANPKVNPTAMVIDQAVAPDALVLGGPCNGAKLFLMGDDGKIVRKTSDTNMAMRLLRSGARAYVGATGLSYSSSDAKGLSYGAGLYWKRIVEQIRKGDSPQKAFMLAKRDFAKAAADPNAAPWMTKQYHQTIYLGLPPEGRRTVATATGTGTGTGGAGMNIAEVNPSRPSVSVKPTAAAIGDRRWADLTGLFTQGSAVDCYSDNAIDGEATLTFLVVSDKKIDWSTKKTPSRLANRDAKVNMGAHAKVAVALVAPEAFANFLKADGVPEDLRSLPAGKYHYQVTVTAPDRGHYASYRLSYSAAPLAVIGRGKVDRPDKGRIYIHSVVPVERRAATH